MTSVLAQAERPRNEGIDVTVELVTPALAGLWLETNGLNRPLSMTAVQRYAVEMREGRWLLDGASIRFAHDGRLLDGQHRLRACIVADTAFTTVVMRGLDPASFTVMDDGRKRTAADVLAISGEKNSAVIAGATRYVGAYEAGRLFAKGSPRYKSWTNQHSVDIIHRHPGLRTSVIFGEHCRAILQPAMGTALHYICAQKDANRADAFFDSLADGLNLDTGNPVYTLRQRLIEERAKKTQLPTERQLELVARAWNAARTGRTLARLQLGDLSTVDIL